MDLAGYGTVNDFHLEIPVMDFKTDRKFDMKEGNRIFWSIDYFIWLVILTHCSEAAQFNLNTNHFFTIFS